MFRETKEGVALSGIERILESGGELGGIKVDVSTTIPGDAKEAFDNVFEGFVGSTVKPFAYLGNQMTKGMNHIFVAEVIPVTKEPETKVAMVAVNSLTKEIAFTDLLASKHDVSNLGYSFTWIKRGTSFGAPLGEWP